MTLPLCMSWCLHTTECSCPPTHRYDYGKIWPNLRESDFDFVGSGRGLGYNCNIPLNKVRQLKSYTCTRLHLGGIFTGPVRIRVRYNLLNGNLKSQFHQITQQVVGGWWERVAW